MYYPILKVKDFKVDTDYLSLSSNTEGHIHNFEFIKVIFDNYDRYEKQIFPDLNTLVKSEDTGTSTYSFIEISKSEKSQRIYLVEKDLEKLEISFSARIEPMPFKREIFLNSKIDICGRDSKGANHSGINIKLFNDLEYYVGLAALIHIFKFSNHEETNELFNEAKQFGDKLRITEISSTDKINHNKSPITNNHPNQNIGLPMEPRERAIYVRALIESIGYRKTLRKEELNNILLNIDKLIEEL